MYAQLKRVARQKREETREPREVAAGRASRLKQEITIPMESSRWQVVVITARGAAPFLHTVHVRSQHACAIVAKAQKQNTVQVLQP